MSCVQHAAIAKVWLLPRQSNVGILLACLAMHTSSQWRTVSVWMALVNIASLFEGLSSARERSHPECSWDKARNSTLHSLTSSHPVALLNCKTHTCTHIPCFMPHAMHHVQRRSMWTLTLAILQIRTVHAVTQVHHIPKALTLKHNV